MARRNKVWPSEIQLAWNKNDEEVATLLKEVAMKEKSQTEDKNKILENIMKIALEKTFLLVVSFTLCILYFLTYFLLFFCLI